MLPFMIDVFDEVYSSELVVLAELRLALRTHTTCWFCMERWGFLDGRHFGEKRFLSIYLRNTQQIGISTGNRPLAIFITIII